MHDKVINVPVEEDSVINTLNLLPRTPEQAGLIEVTFKRKLEMKNSHIRGQLVNPDKLYKVLDNLKSAGNPPHVLWVIMKSGNPYNVKVFLTHISV